MKNSIIRLEARRNGCEEEKWTDSDSCKHEFNNVGELVKHLLSKEWVNNLDWWDEIEVVEVIISEDVLHSWKR